MPRNRALALAGIVFAILLPATAAVGGAREQVLYRFNGKDGERPGGTLVLDGLGNLYGTTLYGGASNAPFCKPPNLGCGTVFKLKPTANGKWAHTVLYQFCMHGSQTNCPDGEWPFGSLIIDSFGNLYGTTAAGGGRGDGTVFELTPGADGKWTHRILHSFYVFDGGGDPTAGVVMDASGNLYGTANQTRNNCDSECGLVFQLKRDGNQHWSYHVLHYFRPDRDGFWPVGNLTIDGEGNLYGVTRSQDTMGGGGIVYKMTPDGEETVLHSSWSGSKEGFWPAGNVTLDTDGNVYGMTAGTVFELTPTEKKWTMELLRKFYNERAPEGGLILDASGNLYGTTTEGGLYYSEGECGYPGYLGCGGTAFKLTPGADGNWIQTTLWSFGGKRDGRSPTGSLVFDSAGNMYGTTVAGGVGPCKNDLQQIGCGTVYKITP